MRSSFHFVMDVTKLHNSYVKTVICKNQTKTDCGHCVFNDIYDLLHPLAYLLLLGGFACT